MASERAMRAHCAVAVLTIACAGGCAELYKGPRVVHYTDTSFYVRHIPPLNGARTADAIAADICSRLLRFGWKKCWNHKKIPALQSRSVATT